MKSSISSDPTSSSPPFSLKLKAFLVYNGMFLFFLIFNVFCLILNVYQTRTIAIIFYLSIILSPLTPSMPLGCEHGNGKPWQKFSEWYFQPGFTMRSYLKLNFGVGSENEEEKEYGYDYYNPGVGAIPLHGIDPEFIEAEQQIDAQFIIAAFPHGCGSDFRILMEGMLHKVMPNIISKDENRLRTLAASVLFYIPFIREISLWTGCIDASRQSASKALDSGKSLLILPGGEQEQLRTVYQEERIYLKKRKGFIKLALRKNIPIVPMYVFGCSDYFHTSFMFFKARLWMVKNLGICIPLSSGLWGSLCPLPKKTTIVMGKPINLENSNMKKENCVDITNKEISQEDIDAAHDLFCKELVCLFDKHKDTCGYADRQLMID